MPLLDYTDYERQANATVSDPEGRELANRIANGILAWSARYCNRLGWAKQSYTEYFSPDAYTNTFYLSALPVDTTGSVTVGTYNAGSDAYDTYLGTVRKNAAGIVRTGHDLDYGHESVAVTYTGGYDVLPDDLRQALSELLVQRFNDATNGGTVVTEVKALDYSEKYSLNAAEIPGDAMEVLASYRLPLIA